MRMSLHGMIGALLFLAVAFSSAGVRADDARFSTQWPAFEKEMREKIQKDRIDGISYIIGGALTLVGGFIGSYQTSDAAESLTYTVFQNVGIASIGYGYTKWRAGDEDRRFYFLLKESPQLSTAERQSLLSRYSILRDESRREERVMRAILHGLLATTNLVAGAREKNKTVKNSLYFLGAINAFASISFTFDF